MTIVPNRPPGPFDHLHEGSLAAAQKILPLIRKLWPFQSVLDVGCGSGAWLSAARELGAIHVCGLNGEEPVDSSIMRVDLEERLPNTGRYDLCLCLEVAEHLSARRAESLVADLVKASDVVAFSAAIPFQGGHGHCNEQWPEYWAAKFSAHHYWPYAGLRKEIWRDQALPWWYRQNLILYVASSRWEEIFPGRSPDSPENLALIHPECYLWNARGASCDARLQNLQREALYQSFHGPELRG